MTHDEALDRIRLEYQEMPDLKLTLAQISRLCGLSSDACEGAISTLLWNGFLKQSASGRYVRSSTSPTSHIQSIA
jgi:hypothetical protein